ncbi:MAG: BON domain-containing protein [Desulfovibrio sp.]|nr:BON domain-containing protein [Desulfovibrio sp.]
MSFVFSKVAPAVFAAFLACFAAAQGGVAYAVDLGRPFKQAGGYVNDSAITTAIKTKFLGQKGLDSLDLRVETQNGVVTLRGQVHSAAQQNLAVKIAGETDGVRKVVNKISVMP